MGIGDIGAALRRLGADVLLADSRIENINIAKKKHPGIRTVQIDVEKNFNFNESFDLILDIALINHISDLNSHLNNLFKYGKYVILEAGVANNSDINYIENIKENQKTDWASNNGLGARFSANYLEELLKKFNVEFKRQDNPVLNCNEYKYDWLITNNSNHNLNLRKLYVITNNSENLNFNNTSEQTKIPIITPAQEINSDTIKNIIKVSEPPPPPPPKIELPKTPEIFVNKSKNNFRVAICLSGLTRTCDRTVFNLKQNIIDPYNADVFIHTWNKNKETNYQNFLINKLNGLYNPKKIIVDNPLEFGSKGLLDPYNRDHRNINNLQSMFYSIFKANYLKSEFEELNNFKYDCVIRCRFDLFFKQKINIKFNRGLYFPVYGNYSGVNDQFAYGQSDLMDKYCDTFFNLNSYVLEGVHLSPELLLHHQIIKENVSILRDDVNYVISRLDGSIFDNRIVERLNR